MIIGSVVALFFVLLILDVTVFAAIVRLLFGWAVLLRQNFVEITIVPHRIASSLVMAFLALAGLHFLAVRWRRWARPDASPWRWSWSLSSASILLAAALAAMAVAGLAHQIAWMGGEPFTETRTSGARNWNSAKQIAMMALIHADDNEGRFPDDLPGLIKAEFGNRDEPWVAHFLLYRENQHATPEPWLYYGAGRSRQDDGGPFPLLAAPRPGKHGRIVASSEGRVESVTEEEFATLLATLRSLP